jgi:transposase
LELSPFLGCLHGAHRHEALLFPERLDDYSAAEHPVRFREAVVDHLDLTTLGFQRATPAATGRPADAPAELWKLYIDGDLDRRRSSRRLAQATHRTGELRWLFKKWRPDHQTIADVRKHTLAPLRQVCRAGTVLGTPLDLCAGERVAIDGSQCKAVNATERPCTRDKLPTLRQQIDQRIAGDLQELDGQDTQDEAGPPGGAVAEHVQAQMAARQPRKRRSADVQAQ